MSQTVVLSAFSGFLPMTDFRQRQATSTLTAPAARGLTPHSLFSPAVILRPARLREFVIQFKNKKGYADVLQQ